MSFYDYTLTTRSGEEFLTSELKGKVVLVVNTATGCDFVGQYSQISRMYDNLHDQGFEVVDIPCTQFPHPDPNRQPRFSYCNEQYHTRFPQFAKEDVRGPNAHPLFNFLTAEQDFGGFEGDVPALVDAVSAMDENYESNSQVKWNFTKFVIDREGNVVARFEPTAPMQAMEQFIKALL